MPLTNSASCCPWHASARPSPSGACVATRNAPFDYSQRSFPPITSLIDDRQPESRGLLTGTKDRDVRRLIVGGLCIEDIRHERLRVTVVEREECRLDLHHDPVTRLEYVVDVGQLESIALDLVGRYRGRMLEAVPIAAAEDVQRDRHFVAAHRRIAGYIRRIDIDHLHDEVAVGACRDRADIRHGNAANTYR